MSKKRDVVVTVRLDDEENEMLKRYSKMCGLSQSAFIRQLCKDIEPKPQQPKEFWGLLEALYDVHKVFKACAE